MLQLICSVWLWPLGPGRQKTKNASANTPILESRVFHRSSFFDECLSYFAQFGFDPPGPGRQKKRNASANILILESRVFHRSSFFDECLSWFAQFGFEAFFSACNKKRNASARFCGKSTCSARLTRWWMPQLICSVWLWSLFLGRQKIRNASANILILESRVFHRSSFFDGCLS